MGSTVTVNMTDFPHMVAGNSYTATLQAVTVGPTLPPYQTNLLKIFWNLGEATAKIIASASSGGTITPSGTVAVKKGEDMKFIITPDNGHRTADVKVDGVSVGGSNFLYIPECYLKSYDRSNICGECIYN